jgi:tetratricopeptide (TPR) repeat protein
VGYRGPDDPLLVANLRAVLRRWHSAALGNAALATDLTSVEHRLAAESRLSRAVALQEVIRAALASLRRNGHRDLAELLEQRYIYGRGLYHLCDDYHLSERSLYYRLNDAVAALAQTLWSLEQAAARAGVPGQGIPEDDRARHLPPPSYTRLFGVEGLLAQLLQLLDAPDDHWLISVEGLGGLGKTALAREAAGRAALAGRFAGIAWLTAKREFYTWRGLEESERPALTYEQLLDGIGEQLGDSGWGPLPLAANQQRVRALLHAQPYLVVVDNLETVADGEALPGHLWALVHPTKFLFTSRHRLAPDAGAYPVSTLSLDELPEAYSLALLRYEGQLRGLAELSDAGDEALRPILAVTGGHPLALKLVVGLLASLPLDRVLARLQESGYHADPFYRFLYRPSWELLTDSGRHLLRTMALLPVIGGAWEELVAASGSDAADLEAAVQDLVAHSLLQASGLADRRYSIHRLTHQFVLSQVMPSDLFAAIALRMGEYSLAYVRQNQDDWAALERRQDFFLQAMELNAGLVKAPTFTEGAAAGASSGHTLVECAQALGPYMLNRGPIATWQPYLEAALKASGDLGLSAAQADLRNQMGQVKGWLGDRETALALHQQAAETFRRLGDALNLGRSLRLQGNVHYTRDEGPAALACYKEALDLIAGLDEPRELSDVDNAIGNVYFNKGDWAQAILYYERALALLDPGRDQPQIRRLLSNIALLRWERGEWRQSVADLLRLLPIQEAAGDRVARANTLHYLFLTYADLEAWEEALSYGRRALALHQDLGSVEGLARLYTDLAEIYSRMGDRETAEAFLVQAWPMLQGLGLPSESALYWLIRGDLQGRAEEWRQAQASYLEALAVLEPTSDLPLRMRAMLGLAHAYGKAGNVTAGQALLPRVEARAEETARTDFRVQALWLQAELDPASARQALEQALALCDVPGNDRFAWLRRETLARLKALDSE